MSAPRFHFTLAAVLVLAGPLVVRVSAQDAQSKGASLLADARKAIAGEDRLRAVKTLQANGSFRRTAGNNTIEGDAEVLIEVPDNYRRNESVGIAGGPTAERTEALNGDVPGKTPAAARRAEVSAEAAVRSTRSGCVRRFAARGARTSPGCCSAGCSRLTHRSAGSAPQNLRRQR